MNKRNEYRKCIFCDHHVISKHLDMEDIYDCICENCGNYRISGIALDDLPFHLNKEYEDKRYLISGYIRELNENNIPINLITSENYFDFLPANADFKIWDKFDRIIRYMYRNQTSLFELIDLEGKPSIAYAKNDEEFQKMIDVLVQIGHIEYEGVMGSSRYSLTLEGISKAEELMTSITDSRQCFVAMWFSEEMMDVYQTSISKAISDAGYNPFIISMKEYNEDVSYEIISEIKKSRFLVADFTGDRGGVYFEAGFAQGIGIPVIWSCRKDWFDTQIENKINALVDGTEKDVIINEKRRVHFDINHYNFIVWGTPDEYYKKLKVRIEATIK